MSRLSVLTPILAYLVVCNTLADPPTPGPPTRKDPGRWEFLGTHRVGVGAFADSVNVLVDRNSIGHDGHFRHVYVGQSFTKVNGHWITGVGWSITDYKIDCDLKTYRKIWVETAAGFQDFEDTWSAIESHDDVELVRRAVCDSSK